MGAMETSADEAGQPAEETREEPVTGDTEKGARKGRMEPAHRIGFAPIVRVDASRREIELCATSETVDSHGTIFDYNASKDAFTRWIGNVREMHGRQALAHAWRCAAMTRRGASTSAFASDRKS